MPQDKRSFSWVILHIVVIAFTLTSLLTGLRIAAVTRPEILYISIFLPQGYLHGIHLVSAAGLIITIASYVYLIFFEKAIRFKQRNFHFFVMQFGYAVMLTLLISGVLLFFGTRLAAQDIHYYAAIALVMYFFLHAVLMFVQYGPSIFKRILVSAPVRLKETKIVFCTFCLFVTTLIFFLPTTDRTLYISEIPITALIDIDGLSSEEIWQSAQPMTIHTHGGANFNGGKTTITVRALHNRSEAFFNITWEDETKSLKHLPLLKTRTGWQVIEDGFYHFDEQTYYEDKFAIMLANTCESGASKTAQLGPKPIKNKPANWHGKGYHYANDHQVRDIWHWKAVRTNDMYIADDNFFGKPDVERLGQRRYSAGYLPDGKESGAYVMNWQWYSPKGVLPKRLPSDPLALNIYKHDHSENWVVPWYDFKLYEKNLDNYPEGTIAPSVLHLSNRFEGDRSHVRARGEWQDGRWTLELVRPLDTHSKNDVALKNGVCFWVSAFDHSQIAHTRHVRPARLKLEGL